MQAKDGSPESMRQLAPAVIGVFVEGAMKCTYAFVDESMITKRPLADQSKGDNPFV